MDQSDGYILIKLKLLKLPVGIGKIIVNYDVTLISGDNVKCGYNVKDNDLKYDAIDERCLNHNIDVSLFKNTKDLKIVIHIWITKVFDDKGREIDKIHWNI